ncbi:MAG: CPXCG motif-containing cysteine-rich protein [Rubricoccaceae bacterium]
MLRETEHFFGCPYCGAEISMLLDLSAGSQTYIEDCEVCCNPIEVSLTVRFEDDPAGVLTAFEARSIEQ